MPRDTTDRLRADIDSGTTGHKQPGSDLAAEPLGTDDEASGAHPSERRMATTRAHGSSSAQTDVSRDDDGIGHAWILIVFVALLAIGLVAFMIWRRGG